MKYKTKTLTNSNPVEDCKQIKAFIALRELSPHLRRAFPCAK